MQVLWRAAPAAALGTGGAATQQTRLERAVLRVLEGCCRGRRRLTSEVWKNNRKDIHHLLQSVQVKSRGES